MTFTQILFYLFGAVLLAASLGVVLVRNPVHAALLLVLSFVTAYQFNWFLKGWVAMTLIVVAAGRLIA